MQELSKVIVRRPRAVAEVIVRRPQAVAVLAMSAILTLPGVAIARSHSRARNGYYASLVGVPSVDVEFHVRGGGKIPDLSLGCSPATPGASATTVDVAVHAPVLTLTSAGRFSYNGPAEVTEDFAGAPKIGTTTLTISGYHVNGPVRHYTFEGRHLKETTAFKGTAGSPACAPSSALKFTLFGPVPGE
ncbi:MAG: hypothetical protein WBV85_12240 [Solirubrobacteraceae bacterium]